MTPPTIESIEIAQAVDGTGPGDDTVFVLLHGGGMTGGYGPISDPIADIARSVLADAVVGAELTDHTGLLRRLCAAVRWSSSAVASWAVGAVDCAAWDLHGRAVARPTASLISDDKARTHVPVYASWLSQDLTGAETSGLVRELAADDWLFTKWGLRLPAAESAEQAASVMASALERCSSRAGRPLAVDAVGTWDARTVLAFIDRIDPAHLLWLEDPLPDHDFHVYGRLAASGLSLAVGERMLVEDDTDEFINRVRPSVLTLDVVGCGGLTRAIEIAHRAHAAGIPVYPHGRSFIPGAHLAAAFSDEVRAVEYRLQWEPRRQRLYELPIEPRDGQLHLPDAPGLGTTPRSRTCPSPR